MEEISKIKQKADYCLGCKNKPCQESCPMNTKIPEFIGKIKEEKLEDAYQILVQNNLFTHICSLICPQEEQCEKGCIRGIKGDSTEIGNLEKLINEWAIQNNIKPRIMQESLENNSKVAIIGAGPSGLACSYELAKKGIKSVVFEKEQVLGGVLQYGIPDFRLDKETINQVIEILKSLGVEFRLGQELGNNISIESLKKEFDYIFIGIGAEISSTYPLTDQKLDCVYDSDTFLRVYNQKKTIQNLGKVVVIGGGNVSMDCARAAVRMGAEKVSILYRRDEEHMPARKIEFEECLKDGVEWFPYTRVDRANLENGKMISVHCNRTQIIDGKVQDVQGQELDIEADTVIFAIGLKPNIELLKKEGLELTEWGTIVVDENYQTSIENVYSGGDVIENKSVVCKALASGKKAAEAIIEKITRG